MTLLYCDLETYSETPIAYGTHRYAEASEVLIWVYAFDDGEVQAWDLTTGDAMPADLKAALDDDSVLTVWHNGGNFDRVILRHALGVEIPIERVHDTMVRALSHSLPGALGDLCDILKVPSDAVKDKEGKRLIQLFCKPLAANRKTRRATRETHPEEWGKFIVYAKSDILAMREVYKRLPRWNYHGDDLKLWHLDQRINDRGIPVDVDLAVAAMNAVEVEQERLANRAQALTDGEIQAATQRDAMLAYSLKTFGVHMADMRGSTIESKLNDPELPPALRELLAIRLSASTTSTAKYKKLVQGVSTDGRLRGTKQFRGASRTGRWAGRLFQPDNLPRPTLKQPVIDTGIEALKAGVADLVCGDLMELTSSTIRGCIMASEGKKLVVADLSNIEGRLLAFLAGEQWKLDAFRDYDTIIGTDENGKPIRRGPDLYKLAYSRSFGIRPDQVNDDQRQVGKVMELALGYQGAVGAFHTFATAYNIDLEELANTAWDTIPADILERSTEWQKKAKKAKRPSFGLSVRAWIVCDAIKAAWRIAHPQITSFWKDLEQAATRAIQVPGEIQRVRNLLIRRDGNWLRIKLPSGRSLCYPSPEIDDDGKITYMGTDQYTRKWQRISTYGGKLAENITQAVAVDVLAAPMPAIEAAGYGIVLTVHDEIISEAPDTDEYNAERLATLMSTVPPWATGLPLNAAGFESKRYRK